MQTAADACVFPQFVPSAAYVRRVVSRITWYGLDPRKQVMIRLGFSEPLNKPSTVSRQDPAEFIVDRNHPSSAVRRFGPPHGQASVDQINLRPSQGQRLARSHTG